MRTLPIACLVLASAAATALADPGTPSPAPVTIQGVVSSPPGVAAPTLRVRCGTGPGGAVSLELVVPGGTALSGFDFTPFEGPGAAASRERLTRLSVSGAGVSVEVRTEVAGWATSEPSQAFVLGATRLSRTPGDLRNVLDAMARAGKGGAITWTQSPFRSQGSPLTATFALDDGARKRIGALAAACLPPPEATPRVEVTLPPGRVDGPVDGRLLLFVSTLPPDAPQEPRFQISERDDTQQVFGIDVEGWAPGTSQVMGDAANGYPLAGLSELPPGEYTVQALLHRYETFRRGDGHVVKLPPDRGEGQSLARAPGNLLSRPVRLRLGGAGVPRVVLDQVIPPIPRPKDTRYVKHVEIPNERLSAFWGRPVSLGAIVVLPEGWHENPDQRYPLAISHGHFQGTYDEMREQPPDPGLPPVDLAGLREHCPNGHEGAACTRYGYERLQQEKAHAFFKTWTSPGFPRAIVLVIQHANPYYDDSYAVNSENLGPYGDAITYDLIPEIERRYRGLGPWARALYGGSTGGWESLAAQIFYPDAYNGAYAACPDPVDFRHYLTIDLYADENAFCSSGPWRSTPRPASRDYLGRTRSTVEQESRLELALGTRSRSGGQWDAWEAVFSPVGPDGYPRRIFDKSTGVVDREVAVRWRETFDLVHVLGRDWTTLGPKLRGKLHVFTGLSDNFFLNDAVYRLEDLLAKASPPADAEVAYGLRDEHCWSGDRTTFNAVSRLTYTERFLPRMAEWWARTAPPGADVTGWRGRTAPGK
ncbi:MAG TPA: hypothetical protein VFM45_11220 [Anaeromyxobacteraceae bacterium]|nr:hypothetical protein [Anaeromyxobacteraceae bacterium]